MKYWERLKAIDLRYLAAALIAIGILHIVATFAAPHLTDTSAYEKLAENLEVNSMSVLPPVTPDNQALPFMASDVRYAMCPYDTSEGPVLVTAMLPARGWSLALHSAQSDNFYTATGQDGRPTQISVLIVPRAQPIAAITATSPAPSGAPAYTVASKQGIAIVRAPDKGFAYSSQIESDLARAGCKRTTL